MPKDDRRESATLMAEIPVIPVDPGNVADTVHRVREDVLATLRAEGAVLIRGFDALRVAEFESVVELLVGDIVRENGEHEPIEASTIVQTPVPFSHQRKLLWHHENSFNRRWPLTLLFSPTIVATVGGRTTIADSRRLLGELDPAIVSTFRERGVCYVRRFGTGLGLPWQKVLGTNDRATADESAAVDGVALEWGAGEALTTRTVRPAIIRHPLTGEEAWFAQPTHWHPACLDEETREALVDVLGADGLPRDCLFGDGSVIPDSIVRDLVAAYESIERSFDWVVGDVFVVDNVLNAHAREPYEGPRQLLVSMGDQYEFRQRVGPDVRRVVR